MILTFRSSKSHKRDYPNPNKPFECQEAILLTWFWQMLHFAKDSLQMGQAYARRTAKLISQRTSALRRRGPGLGIGWKSTCLSPKSIRETKHVPKKHEEQLEGNQYEINTSN